MSRIRFPAQRDELQRLLKQSHLSYSQLAQRVGIKSDTVEKYAEGWQSAGKSTLVAIRQVCTFEKERLDRAAGKISPDLLHEEAVAYAGKLLELPPDKRNLAKAMIDQLHDVSSKAASLAEDAIAKGFQKHAASRARQRLLKGKHTPKADLPIRSDHRLTDKESTPLPSEPKKPESP
jgi:transcriptional regulator with XRE-family HTH domain